MGKQGRSWGKQGKTEAAGGRRGCQAGGNRKGISRIGEGPGRNTSKAGKGPLKHHEENRKELGQKKREAQRASRANTEEQWGSREEAGKNRERPRWPEAAEAAKQERTGEEPAGSGKGQGERVMDHGNIGQEQNRRREDSGRELATKTEPEKIREGTSKAGKGPLKPD